MYPHPPPPPAKKGLSTGAIIAIVLGSVGLVGIVAAIALGVTAGKSFKKYASKSKTSEAMLNLRMIRMRAEQVYLEEGRYPVGPDEPTPGLRACCEQNGKCAPDPSEWRKPHWEALRFSVEDPHYYVYTFVSDGTSFTIRAQGDLDCDGVYSTFELTHTDDVVRRVNELE